MQSFSHHPEPTEVDHLAPSLKSAEDQLDELARLFGRQLATSHSATAAEARPH